MHADSFCDQYYTGRLFTRKKGSSKKDKSPYLLQYQQQPVLKSLVLALLAVPVLALLPRLQNHFLWRQTIFTASFISQVSLKWLILKLISRGIAPVTKMRNLHWVTPPKWFMLVQTRWYAMQLFLKITSLR